MPDDIFTKSYIADSLTVKSHLTGLQPGSADLQKLMSDCTLCPRNCHANRIAGEKGFCGQTAELVAARAALHMWEEPCISGTHGSGTVFFSGCNLKCVFCQNHSIANGRNGHQISGNHLAEIFLHLQEQGAHNINLVTPTHFVPQICLALQSAKEQGLTIPIVYNTGSYEHVDTLKLLEGLVDIYLPDLKYYDSLIARDYSNAGDYFDRASLAIAEMFRQTGPACFDTTDKAMSKNGPVSTQQNFEESMMKRGIIVRHLLLPGQTKDSKKILRYLHNTYGNDIYISIMSQYTPLPHVANIPALNRKVTLEEYQRVIEFALKIGIENGFFQEGEAANESFIPEFDGLGL